MAYGPRVECTVRLTQRDYDRLRRAARRKGKMLQAFIQDAVVEAIGGVEAEVRAAAELRELRSTAKRPPPSRGLGWSDRMAPAAVPPPTHPPVVINNTPSTPEVHLARLAACGDGVLDAIDKLTAALNAAGLAPGGAQRSAIRRALLDAAARLDVEEDRQ